MPEQPEPAVLVRFERIIRAALSTPPEKPRKRKAHPPKGKRRPK